MKENNNANKTQKAEKEINYIPLVENFYYGADQNQYILFKKVRKEKCEWKTRKPLGEYYDAYDIAGYYTNFSMLLKACVTQINRDGVESGEIKTLKEHIQQISDLYDRLEDLVER